MLQYTVYAVMMPFFGMGGDQLASSWLGEPGMVDKEKANGDDGTAKDYLPHDSKSSIHIIHINTYN